MLKVLSGAYFWSGLLPRDCESICHGLIGRHKLLIGMQMDTVHLKACSFHNAPSNVEEILVSHSKMILRETETETESFVKSILCCFSLNIKRV